MSMPAHANCFAAVDGCHSAEPGLQAVRGARSALLFGQRLDQGVNLVHVRVDDRYTAPSEPVLEIFG